MSLPVFVSVSVQLQEKNIPTPKKYVQYKKKVSQGRVNSIPVRHSSQNLCDFQELARFFTPEQEYYLQLYGKEKKKGSSDLHKLYQDLCLILP